MNKFNELYERNKMIFTFLIVLVVLIIVIPLLLMIPPVKCIISFFLSFTGNNDFKVAYIEIIGAIVGSFIAIYGALWTQRKINEEEKKSLQAKYAQIVYYDLKNAFDELIKIFKETKRKYSLDRIEGEDGVDKFCEVAIDYNLYINPTWQADVAQLNEVFLSTEVTHIYKCYGRLVNIDNALQSKDKEKIKNIFVSDICWMIDGIKEEAKADIRSVMDKINKIGQGVEEV